MTTESTAQASGAEHRARRRLVAERGFYVHLMTYVAVISGLFLVNLITGSGRWWFIWPALGWGIGIAAHGLATFGLFGWMGRDWEDRRLKELIDEEHQRRV